VQTENIEVAAPDLVKRRAQFGKRGHRARRKALHQSASAWAADPGRLEVARFLLGKAAFRTKGMTQSCVVKFSTAVQILEAKTASNHSIAYLNANRGGEVMPERSQAPETKYYLCPAPLIIKAPYGFSSVGCARGAITEHESAFWGTQGFRASCCLSAVVQATARSFVDRALPADLGAGYDCGYALD